MADDLNSLARRANISLANEEGFLECVVETVTPPVLAYRFATNIDAEGFKAGRLALAETTGFSYSITNGRPKTVLEHHKVDSRGLDHRESK